MTIVEINHLQVTFAEKTAVSAASFSVNAGETFSLIGESGCGKSTILRVIAGLQRDWHGQVSLFGHTIKPGMRFQCIDSLEVRKKTGRTLDYSGSDGIRFGGACKPVAQILVVNQ